MDKLFGTDGIRGLAGEFPLDDATVKTVGASLARQFNEKLGRPANFVTGRDTRESGPAIEAAFHAGVCSENGACESAGVITTPGVAYLTGSHRFDAGIVISASHNPYHDNGIKIFLPSGQKIDGVTERAIERDIYSSVSNSMSFDESGVNAATESALQLDYVTHLESEFNGLNLGGLKIIVDCANGAASHLAPQIFRDLGADVIAINNKPDGKNINKDCGSLNLEDLQAKVLAEQADLGIAFDGDADRALFIDENGDLVDGDATLWIMAKYFQDHGKLANKTVVATVMSNIGLETALVSRDLKLVRAAVGDKYVLEELLRTGSEIGGEQSGHIILPEKSLVGDGIMTALFLLQARNEKQLSLSEMTAGFTRYPQILVNVKVREKRPFKEVAEITSESAKIENEIAGKGRLLLRYSGTENLARVMIEGEDQSIITEQANRLAGVIKARLG